jgi:hypothetical protein
MRMKKAADSTGRKAYLFLLLIAVIFFMTLSCKPDQLSQVIEEALGVPVPELSMEGGTYTDDIAVAIACGLEGVTIHHALDGVPGLFGFNRFLPYRGRSADGDQRLRREGRT